MSNKNYREKVEVLVFKGDKVCVCVPDTKRNIYNFPGGGVDKGESMSDAAQRECLEEVGFSVTDVRSLNAGDIFLSGSKAQSLGFDGTRVSYYIAKYHREDRSLLGKEGDDRRYEWMSIASAMKCFEVPDSQFDASRRAVLELVRRNNLYL